MPTVDAKPMTAETDLLPLPEPKFGDWLRGIYASESNPQRDGMYVRTIRRSGRMNPGKYYELTDGKGEFWQYPAKSTERVDRVNVEHHTAAQAAEIEALRNLCGMAYQLAGVHDAPEPWLDALSNAAVGVPFETEGLLPYMPESVASTEALRELAESRHDEIERLRDGWHMANGTAELAMKHRDAAEARAERLAEALRVAEAALADIGDADREPGDDVSWCERRAALGLRVVRDTLHATQEAKR